MCTSLLYVMIFIPYLNYSQMRKDFRIGEGIKSIKLQEGATVRHLMVIWSCPAHAKPQPISVPTPSQSVFHLRLNFFACSPALGETPWTHHIRMHLVIKFLMFPNRNENTQRLENISHFLRPAWHKSFTCICTGRPAGWPIGWLPGCVVNYDDWYEFVVPWGDIAMTDIM